MKKTAETHRTVETASNVTRATGDPLQQGSSTAFVLHRYPYKETSLIIETFTRSNGRMAMVAKGAKRSGSSNKFTLNVFQPLRISWFGRAEMKTLKIAEHERILPQLSGAALMSAFYINELLLKLAVKDDPHEMLFDSYETAIASLTECSGDSRMIEIALRNFELTLLTELGYALTLDTEANGAMPLRPEIDYFYVIDKGAIPLDRVDGVVPYDSISISGTNLLAIAKRDWSDAATLQKAKQLMRRAINHHLGDKSLYTRQLILEMR